MDREQKEAAVREIAEGLGEAEAIFAIDYRGISVPGAAELRAKLAEAEAVFKVVKNRLAKLAAEQAGTEGLTELLEGPTALTLIKGDPVTAAKAISTFSREHQVLEYKGGIMDGAPLDPEGFKTIARLPALDVLHGQLVGMAASPLTGLVRGLGSMVGGLAVALGQIHDQGLVTGEEPEAPAEEPADEEPEAPAEEPAAEAEPENTEEPAAEAAPPEEPGAEDETSEEPAEESDDSAEATPQETASDEEETSEESSEED